MSSTSERNVLNSSAESSEANVPIPNIADYKLVNEKGATKYYEVKELNTVVENHQLDDNRRSPDDRQIYLADTI